MGTIPLHQSLFKLCRQQMASDEAFLQANGFREAPDVDADLFEQYRWHKLKGTIKYVAEKSRFYRKLFADSGFNPDQVHGLADLDRLPLTHPDQLAADPYAFLCVSQSRVERVISFCSSGTTGPKKHLFFSEEDIQGMTDYMAVGLATVEGGDDVVQILLPEGPVMGQSDLLARGAEKLGAKAVLSGMFSPPEAQIQAIKDNGSRVLFGETHLLYRITKTMEKKCDLGKLGVKTVFVTTSYASPAMIAYLQKAWNANVSTHYGMTEMGLGLAVDCPICQDYHFNELDVIAEVIDPESGRSLPTGSTGELVFTTIQRQAMPLLRYRSRDLAVLAGNSNPCGSPFSTISHVHKRIESIIELQNGVSIYPTRFHDDVFSVPEIIDYDLTLETRDHKDLLVFDIETTGDPEKVLEPLRRKLQEIVSADLSPEAAVEVRPTPEGALRQGPAFKKMIKDHRGASDGCSAENPE